MAKYSKTEVRYRPAIGGAKTRCANCISYQEAESGFRFKDRRHAVVDLMMAKVRSNSPVLGFFQFSHNPPRPKGEPSFIAMA
jgi:hypothetical protein